MVISHMITYTVCLELQNATKKQIFLNKKNRYTDK